MDLTDFRRRVNCVLGLPIDTLSSAETIDHIRTALAARSQCWLCTSNVQYLVETRKDRQFRDTVIKSDLSLTDGIPLIWLARLMGVRVKERVAGSDLFDALMSGKGGALKVFFFGGPDGVAEKACRRLNASPGPLVCVGFVSPGYGSVEQMSDPAVIEQINLSGADFLVVALGAKKGQAWIERNRHILTVPVMSHLGAVINFVAGTILRAPVWMRNSGMEWLWRIKEEPRLWRRYMGDLKSLMVLVITRVPAALVWRAIGFFDRRQSTAGILIDRKNTTPGRPVEKSAVHPARATLSGKWLEADLPLLQKAFETLTREPGDIELQVGSLEGVGSAFVALLLLLYGHQRKIDRRLTLLSPSRTLRCILRLHCAEFLFSPIERA
ncbi:MAG: WecB/TagA/CpsF family glycosyltransferase [Betaproteobacteria bacterium]